MGSEHVASICMPVAAYEPHLLRQAVESVLDQTSPRWDSSS